MCVAIRIVIIINVERLPSLSLYLSLHSFTTPLDESKWLTDATRIYATVKQSRFFHFSFDFIFSALMVPTECPGEYESTFCFRLVCEYARIECMRYSRKHARTPIS